MGDFIAIYLFVAFVTAMGYYINLGFLWLGVPAYVSIFLTIIFITLFILAFTAEMEKD